MYKGSKFCIVKNPYTGKFHIFTGSKDTFFNEYDNIEEYDFGTEKRYVVTLNGNKAIFDANKGFVSDFIFKGELSFKKYDIQVSDNVICGVYEINGKKALYYNGFITNFNYDGIELKENVFIFEKGEDKYLYSRSIYNLNEEKLTYVGNSELNFVDDAVIWNYDSKIKSV